MDDIARKPSKVRRFFRTYLGRAVIGLALLVIVQIIVFLVIMVPFLRERRIAKELESLGGFVQYVDHRPRWFPLKLYQRLPVFQRIERVSFFQTVPKSLPPGIASLSSLEELNLQGPTFADAGMKQLKTLTRLKRLYLNRTSVTDVGLKELTDLTDLRILELNETKITDLGIENVSVLKQLRWISLTGTLVTDKGLIYLTKLPHLYRIYLRRTKITDAGLERLMEIPDLTMLDISHTQVTKEGLGWLKLKLPKCKVTQMQ